MTEQEYCDLTNLQLARTVIDVTKYMGFSVGPNKLRLQRVNENLRKIIADLEKKILIDVYKK